MGAKVLCNLADGPHGRRRQASSLCRKLVDASDMRVRCRAEAHRFGNGLRVFREAVGLRLQGLGDVVGRGNDEARCLAGGVDQGGLSVGGMQFIFDGERLNSNVLGAISRQGDFDRICLRSVRF